MGFVRLLLTLFKASHWNDDTLGFRSIPAEAFQIRWVWFVLGLLWCITILGIPVGLQCFKFASLTIWPFGRDVEYGGGVGRLLLNILWIIFGGLIMAILHALIGLLYCITIIGIPFGLQHFKMAKLALMPFGAEIVSIEDRT